MSGSCGLEVDVLQFASRLHRYLEADSCRNDTGTMVSPAVVLLQGKLVGISMLPEGNERFPDVALGLTFAQRQQSMIHGSSDTFSRRERLEKIVTISPKKCVDFDEIDSM